MKKILIIILALSYQCLAFEPKVISEQRFDINNYDDSIELSDDGRLLFFDSEKVKKNCKSVVSLFCDSVIAPQLRLNLSNENSQLHDCLDAKNSVAFTSNNSIYLVAEGEYSNEFFAITNTAGACKKEKIGLGEKRIQFVGFSNGVALFLYANSGGGWDGFIQYDVKKMELKEFIDYGIVEDMMAFSESGIFMVNNENQDESCVFQLQPEGFMKRGCFNAFPDQDSGLQAIISPNGRFFGALHFEEDGNHFYVRVFDLEQESTIGLKP